MFEHRNEINRAAKLKEQAQLAEDIATFIANGGVIQKIPYGQTSKKSNNEPASKIKVRR